MDVHVSLAGPGDLASRIYRQLLDAILDGRLRPGERLPPTRDLAGRLAVARNTVSVAYERLAAEGYVVARVGAGTFVATAPAARTPSRARTAPTGHGVRPRPIWQALTAPTITAPATTAPSDTAPSDTAPTDTAPTDTAPTDTAPTDTAPTDDPPPVHDFRVGTPDPGLFPFATWRRLVAGELRATAVRAVTGYAEPAGNPGLRQAIARYVGLSRSVRADAEDVLVTQGAQQALDLVGRVLLEPGDRVAVEEPGYPAARLLFRSLGARVVGVPVDEQGLVVHAIPTGTRLVHVTPSHQFPLGMPMSPARRAELLDWAARHDAVIVEDDYDSEFRFADRPLDPLHSLDRTGRVVYVGTFSKTLLPLLRLGFLIAPASLRPALRTAKQITDWHGEYVGQAALARFIDSGELSRHVRRATRVYAERRERVLTALRTDLADWLDPVPSAAGLHLSATLKPDADLDLDATLTAARAAGVAVERLAAYHADSRPRSGLVLGYGAVATAGIGEGLRLLAHCFRHPPR